MLVEMARKGDVNPWNIDVIEVADKFLLELEKAQKLDLRVSGRVLLYAAILVRMKAEILSAEAMPKEEIVPDEVDFQVFYEEQEDFEDEVKDEVLKTLLSPRKKIRRFTTLKDLIHELQMAEKVEKRRKKRKKEKEIDITRTTLTTPHEEDIEETIAKVEEELKYLFSRRVLLYFSEIVKGMKIEEKISYYLSILHLAYRKKIEVSQKRLYEEDIELRLYGYTKENC
jgi:segregation and condensation protein A